MPRKDKKHIKNLITLDKRTKIEQREICSKGGKASGVARNEKKTFKSILDQIQYSVVTIDTVSEFLSQLGIPEDEKTYKAAIIAGLMKEAMSGNTSAVRTIMELTGEDKEEEKDTESKYKGLPAEVLGGSFQIPYLHILSRRYSDFDFKGGRGSLKSSSCALFMIDQIERNPRFCGLAVRQLKDNLTDSVYSQIVWAIDVLSHYYPHIADDYKCTKSPMIITKISTGQKIYFRGGDDPNKIKSIKPPKDMHIGVVWIEEADQLKGEDALRNIKQSAFRGGDDGILLRSYNTPRSKKHYINLEELKPNPRRFVHKSHFKDAPFEWLGQRFYEDAEHLQLTNPTAYAHEYDGEPVGHGSSVFENVKVREITHAELSSFDRPYYGLDWGYYPDPMHFGGMHFDTARQTLYIYKEIRLWKSSNENTAKELDDYRGVRITADSAEPKSVDDLKAWGFNIEGAIKGPGSVDYSMKWLQSLVEIVIDPELCPHTAEEFVAYEYEKTPEGEIISGYPDADNHAIDMTRYALESVWRRRGQ